MIELTTPALLFPCVSLLLLAYTNRFLGLASLIRSLHSSYQSCPNDVLIREIEDLRYRILLIRVMQCSGVLSLFVCVCCMCLFYFGFEFYAECAFGLSLILLLCSLGVSVWEVNISARALNLHVDSLQRPREEGKA